MNLVVTGGLGHIGSYFLRNFSEITEPACITIIDSLQTQRFVSLFELPKNISIKFLEKDVQAITSQDLREIGKIDALVHLAAITDASGTVDKREELFKNNLGSTKHIIDRCGEFGIPMIFPSSTSVYGTQENLVDETSLDLFPQSPYAECKLSEEKEVISAARAGLKAVVFRFGTIHGVSPGMRFHTAVNRFCYQTAIGVPLTVWKTALHQLRPYLAVSDATRAIRHVIVEELLDGQIFNVVTENKTVDQIIKAIENATGKKCEISLMDNRIMNQLSYEVSNKKFSDTGFEFQGSLDQDVSDTMKLLSGLQR